MKSGRRPRRKLKRAFSFFMTFGLILNVLFGSGFPLLEDKSAGLVVRAAEEEVDNETLPTYTPTTTSFTPGTVYLPSIQSIVDYCYLYKSDTSFASAHQNDDVIMSLTNDPTNRTLGDNFVGLGSKDYPFSGTVQFAGNATQPFTLKRAFFGYVYDHVILYGNNNKNTDIVLQLTRNGSVEDGKSSPLFADHVLHGNGNSYPWNVEASSSEYTYSGLIGTIDEGAVVEVNFDNKSSAAMISNSEGYNKNVGAICGRMKKDSQLTVTYSGTANVSITSTNANAGGFVGSMEDTAGLTVNSIPSGYAPSVNASNGYAGGIAGDVNSDISLSFPANVAIDGTIVGNGAGGLFGHYLNKNLTETFDISTYFNGVKATAVGTYAGGLFGVFENDSNESDFTVTFTGTNTSDNHKSENNNTYDKIGHYGGLIGKYSTGKLSDSLVLSDLEFKSESALSFMSYGGVIGIVENDAYIKVDTIDVTAKGTGRRDTKGAYFGGVIGRTSEECDVFVDLGDYKLRTGSEKFRGGGVAGSFKNGVLRISGTTDLSSAATYGTYSTSDNTAKIESCYGQLVGENDNVLVYALGNGEDSDPASFEDEGAGKTVGWKYIRSNGSVADDLGTWGEVVRIVSDGSDDMNIETAGIVTFNPATHTVTLAAAVPSNMSNTVEFTKTALNIMLNNGSSSDIITFNGGSARDTLLAGNLSIDSDISLAGTGINGFMRDGSPSISISDTGSVGVYTGTFNGGNHTITFATGEAYGKDYQGNAVSVSSEGVGQIYRHQYNGLFSVIGNGTTGTGKVQNLTIGGNVYIHNAGPNGMSYGGVAARSHGNTTLENITASQIVNYYENRDTTGATAGWAKYLGGLIGYTDKEEDNGTVDIKGTTVIDTTFNLSGKLKDRFMCAGAIAGVNSKKINIKFAEGSSDSLIVTMDSVPAVGVGSDTAVRIGGLISYVDKVGKYSDKKITVDHTTFGKSDNPLRLSNPSTQSVGGLFGYSWNICDVNVKGVTVTNANLDYSAPEVGIFAYAGTGRWIVDSVNVDGLTLTGGGSTSLGILVNKMYSLESNNVDGALYLDVLNKGYVLNGSGISLPGTLGVYDEIAAYSATDVIKGNAGLISINMNSSRSVSEAKITTTGTYQNKLGTTSSAALTSSKYANPNSRYYYNIDKMSTSNAGQKLVLWSAKKYVHSSISDTITDSGMADNNVTGNADLTGLSYYPIAVADSYTLKDLNVTFDYDGLYTTAENTFTNSVVSDNYIRDPGATSTDKNQHYLMHSGLFIDLPAGKTINVSGTSSLSGSFLEVDSYKAALISGTMRGNLNISGKFTLSELVPKTTGDTAFSNGYLLVNSISRPDDQVPTVSVDISGLGASGYSSVTLPIARSLIGSADGRGFSFNLTNIKLDGRKATVPDTANKTELNSSLTDTYGTSRSLFSHATLFYSINTDQNAEMSYNFTHDDDWGTEGSTVKRDVTYGMEISHTVENWDSEGSKSRQSKYSGTNKSYTRPDVGTVDQEYDFSKSVFLPYVYQPFNPDADHSGKYYRELKVNYLLEIESKGCGTYNDPYIIESADQLVAIANFLKSGNSPILNLGSITLPKDSSAFNGIAANTTGNRWCTDKEGDGYHAEYTAEVGTDFTSENGSAWAENNVKYYLANAYYKINKNIVLDSTFPGLGGSSANTAFRGVIVGDTDSEGAPLYTITNKSSNPFINVSNGCVIKNVNINVNFSSGITLEQKNAAYNNAYFGYEYESTNTCKFYGGIIGELMGGDTIIDNSYVTFSNTAITLKGTNGTIVPVGGYVGVIVFGGLIFKNMDAEKTTISATGLRVNAIGENYNLANNGNKEAWAAIYVNPIVGRVINGYAVNETDRFSVTEDNTYHDDANNGAGTTRSGVAHTLKNGKKHYSIADIDKTETDKLDVTSVPSNASTDGNIDVPNAQALFILSLITQSTAGTAQAIKSSGAGSQTDVMTETGRETDDEGNVTIYKTRNIVNNGALCDYTNSLSYGTYDDLVYGMSHNASYNDVGTSGESSDDYNSYINGDTAANSALPYIIRHYTEGGYGTTTSTTTSTEVEEASAEGRTVVFNGDDPDGKEIYIYNDDYYLNPDKIDKGYGPDASKSSKPSKALLFTKLNNGKYTISYLNGTTRKYLGFTSGNGRALDFLNNQYEFTILKSNDAWVIEGNTTDSLQRKYIGLRNKDHFTGQTLGAGNGNGNDGTALVFYYDIPPSTTTTTTITTTNTTTTGLSYPARCVTSTAGYYDINLTGNGTYQLPDSYRGIGSIGIYDEAVNNTAKFGIKLDIFDGNDCTIDQDIYLNKFKIDNYLNILHSGTTQNFSADNYNYSGNATGGTNKNNGIGLFDRVNTKNSDSKIYNFTLSGSVNTEIYSNEYLTSNQEQIYTGDSSALWISTGGVCGWSGNGNWITFDNILMNNLSVRGSGFIGGLLAYSGTSSESVLVKIVECGANDISIEMTASHKVDTDSFKARNGMGCFVGKVLEGGVVIYGTSAEDSNTSLEDYSTVKIKAFDFADYSKEYYVSAGGLVGFAGNGCKVYDMKVMPSEGKSITIGSDLTRYAGGLVGLMQPYKEGQQTCVAEFHNCTVEEININGHYAGGFYGGKWINNYAPYRIELDNCQMLGNENIKNTIKGNEMAADGYAGGFLGCGNVYTNGNPNIHIKDSIVSNYIITSDSSNASTGGFIGYSGSYTNNSSITCYIHDSSVENCIVGTGDNYSGGAIGKVVRKSASSNNKILGYNIKLDNVTSDSSSIGAWIGNVASNDNTTSIQFTGVGIYGNGFARNVGNRTNFSKASFVFADYTGACNNISDNSGSGSTDTIPVSNLNKGTVVDMPKYPYVNINPQSDIGIDEIISGDGAVLYNGTVSGYSGYTSANTMAAKIYSEKSTSGTAQQYYSTFEDTIIKGNDKLDAYLKRGINDDGDRISTYYTEKKTSAPSGVDDFAVIVIANNDNTETTNLINRYIQLVTNTTTDYASTNEYFDVDIKTCRFNSGAFTVDNTVLPSISNDTSAGTFSLVGENADSKRGNTFTLIDVKFKDPMYPDKIAYHLYVPVYTIKQIEVEFSAAAVSETNSTQYNKDTGAVTASEYNAVINDNSKTMHFDSLNTWITQYVRFKYTKEDINGLINTNNLKWNHDKFVIFDTANGDTNARLPDNTYMVLVDPNGGSDRVFYMDGMTGNNGVGGFETYVKTDGGASSNNGWIIDFNKFKNGNTNFTVNDFVDTIAPELKCTTVSGTGNYNTGGTASNYDIYSYDENGDKVYYLFAAAGNGNTLIELDHDYTEDYYLSMYVPLNEGVYNNELYWYEITVDDTLEKPNKVGASSAHVKNMDLVNKTKKFTMFVADLYEQTTTNMLNVSPENEQITSNNRELTVTARTEIRVKNRAALIHLVSADLYHSFNLSLTRYYNDGSTLKNIVGLDRDEDQNPAEYDKIKARYSIDSDLNDESPECYNINMNSDEGFINVQTSGTSVMTQLLADQNLATPKPLVINAEVVMKFDADKIDNEFPLGTGNSSVGVNVGATSNLAYKGDANSLAYSSMAKAFTPQDYHYYYRESVDTAHLYYSVTGLLDQYDKDGRSSENHSRLGINGKKSDTPEGMEIKTTATYNVTSISGHENADHIRLSFSLQQKYDIKNGGTVTGVEYRDVHIDDYLSGNVVFSSGSASETVNITSDMDKIYVDLPAEDCETIDDGVYKISITFYPVTGDGFTDYANYKINLFAELYDDASNVDQHRYPNSGIGDYVVYTNAKIITEFIKDPGE